MTTVLRAVGVLLTMVGLSAYVIAEGDHWPQWRGPDGLGVSAERGFVTEWGPTTNIRWKTEIPGRGHSSPAVWGDRIFLTSSLKGEQVPGRTAPVHSSIRPSLVRGLGLLNGVLVSIAVLVFSASGVGSLSRVRRSGGCSTRQGTRGRSVGRRLIRAAV